MAIQTLKVSGIDDLETAFSAMLNEQAQAVIVQLSLPRKPIVDHALKLRLPLFGPSPLLAREGGLISYSFHQGDLYRRAAAYVDRILKGEKPAHLPVEFPVRFELVVNQTTAKKLGITMPSSLLARADEVIE